MPSKTEEYLALAQRTANGLTRYWESWTDYLTTASRLYKYPFADQLMIYAQRPDATACADFDIWNNRMNRYVRRGAKGIALLDESSGFPRLHYVFDVSDTGVRRNSRDPDLWQYNDDLKQPVSDALTAAYGISHERVSQQLADIAGKLVADYWDNNSEDIRAIVDGSFLMDYDSAGLEMQFKSAAAISVTYTLLERCGFEPDGYFDKDSFQAIYSFSTPDAVYALGAAVSDISREVLRTVERAVKTTIRRRNNERSQHEYEQQSELHADRGLPSPEPDPASAEDPAGQVRQDALELSETASPGAVQHDAPEREPVPDPDRTGADRSSDEGADDDRTAGEEPGPGQRAESDGVGTAHEQPESAGRGTGADGTDLQLSFFDAHIPTEAQQIETIDQAESEKTPSAFVLSQAEIENELRKHGSGFEGGKQRIMALYQTQTDRTLRAKALAKEYGIGGHSHDFLDGSRGFVNHDWKGLEFDHYPDHQKITLKWAQVEQYIGLMVQSDRYLTDREKEHYTPPAPVNAEPDATLTHAKNLIRDFCLEEYDSEPDFSDLSKIGIAYTNATDEEIPIQVNVDLVGYRVERYLGEVLIDERQYESLEDLTETELEALDFSELVSVTDEELEHYHKKAEEHPALLPLGTTIHMEGRAFRVDTVDYDRGSVTLQDVALAEMRMPIFREEPLALVRELYEQEQDVMERPLPDYKVGDNVIVDLPTRTIEGKIGYVGETDVRIDTSAQGQSWDNEVINKRQFEDGLRQNEPNAPRPVRTEKTVAVYPAKENNLPFDIVIQTISTEPPTVEAEHPAPEPAGNFHITDDDLGVGGPKQKFARNIEAIRTLFKLEEEHRGATAEEQQVLSQYVGWGGLADAFDPDKDNWAKEYTELKGLLSEDEYAAARASTLNAHYTSPVVIRAIYDAVEKMGFKSGNILEPSIQHDVMLRVVKILNVLMIELPFAACWFLYYSHQTYANLAWEGHFAILGLFFILYIVLGKIYDAFWMSMQRVSELVYGQILGAMATDGILYIVICLMSAKVCNLLPGIAAIVGQLVMAAIWASCAHKWYYTTFPPQKTAVVYDVRHGMEKLINEYGLSQKYDVQVTLSVSECLENLSILDGMETVFVSGVHSHERNIILKHCVGKGINMFVIPRVGDVIMSGAWPMHMFHLPMLRVGRYMASPEFLFIKRAMDIVISLVALIILSPLFLITAIAVKSDGGPAFYKQVRLTKDGKQFEILKFRSMRVDAEKDGVARLSTGDKDDRITKVGHIIRACRLDELPQLLNILKGDLSVVGPRPERPEIAAQYCEEMPEFALRLQAKAGLTGYAQVYGKYNTTPYDKLQMDLMYIAHPSLIEDLKIMLATVKILFMPESTEGVAEGATTAMGQQ